MFAIKVEENCWCQSVGKQPVCRANVHPSNMSQQVGGASFHRALICQVHTHGPIRGDFSSFTSLLNFRQTQVNIFRLTQVQFVLDYLLVPICGCQDRIKVQLHFPGLSCCCLPSRLENDEGLPGAVIGAAAALLRWKPTTSLLLKY